MFNLIKFDASRPVIARSAGRSVVAHANFALRGLCERIIRQTRFGGGTQIAEATGVDGMNEDAAAIAERAEEMRNRAEQGHDTGMPMEEQAGLLKLVRDAIACDLEDNAGRKPMLTDPSKTMPDTYHVGAAFEESIDWQLRQKANLPSETRITAEAKALNVTAEDIRRVVLERHTTQVQFLRDNKEDIIAKYHGLIAFGQDGHPYGVGDIAAVFDRLPAMTRLRLYKAADTGLFKQRDKELARHLGIAPRPQGEEHVDTAGNIALIDGTRRELLKEVAELMKQPTFAREIEEAQARGANLPTFSPAPHVQELDEKDLAMQKRKAA